MHEIPRNSEMWSLSNTISNIRLRKVSTEPNLCWNDNSDDDDDNGSSFSKEEGLECPICYESFNIVENVPYVLWCGHTLCQNCVLGLQWAVLKLPTQRIRFPLFISCPWCSSLSLRLVYRGNLRFPQKNYFILWMVESLNVEQAKSLRGDTQQVLSPRRSPTMARDTHSRGQLRNSLDFSHLTDYINMRRAHFSLHKSIDYLINFAAKFHLVIIFLVIIFMVIPGSVAILVLYLLVTFLLAMPSLLVLYFAYPMLEWLLREIGN